MHFLYIPIGKTIQSFQINLRAFNSSYSSKTKSYSLGFLSGHEINCEIDNLLIRHKDKSVYYYLTDKELKIRYIDYLFRFDTLHKIDRFLYRVIDYDSNKDGELNDEDVVGLYIFSSSGEYFRRISPRFQQLIDFETMDIEGILYFRTMEDIDRNGYFDEKDRINLYEYNLLKEDTLKLVFNQDIYKK